MSYAIRKDGQGWRAVDSAEDCSDDEYFSEEIPAPVPVEWSPDALLGKFREARETVLNRLAGICIFSTNDEVKSACSSARAALLSLPESKGVVAAKDDDSLKLAIFTAYKEIVRAAPDALKNAFSELG